MIHPRTFALIASIIFSAVAILHLARLIAGWDFAIGGWDVPVWASVIGVVVPGWLAFEGFRMFQKPPV